MKRLGSNFSLTVRNTYYGPGYFSPKILNVVKITLTFYNPKLIEIKDIKKIRPFSIGRSRGRTPS